MLKDEDGWMDEWMDVFNFIQLLKRTLDNL